ncbi:hypothetical protein JOB18_047785 [Solea senegalensis]|uniref:Uncharacterized protein n=1 Tax=Solea senegalensis TaxID=28829 RepID=A0AAV6S753_SOLSE|nr:hypothetical protein JOB18_047785 [Solea senegalensis]
MSSDRHYKQDRMLPYQMITAHRSNAGVCDSLDIRAVPGSSVYTNNTFDVFVCGEDKVRNESAFSLTRVFVPLPTFLNDGNALLEWTFNNSGLSAMNNVNAESHLNIPSYELSVDSICKTED